MLSAYPACFIKEENGYSVIFPDLNNLSTCGHTLDEAFSMAVDCLAGYLHWLQKDGEIAPAASSIERINPAKIAEELDVIPEKAFVNIVTVDVEEYAKVHFEKSVKKTLTIPEAFYKNIKSDFRMYHMYKYERIIYWSNEDNAFIVEVPELPGCMADGKTIEEAIANAEIVIKEWIEVTLERGLEVPEPKGRLMYA